VTNTEVDNVVADIEQVLLEAQDRMRSVELKVQDFAALESSSSIANTNSNEETQSQDEISKGFGAEMVEKKKEARKARPRLGSARKITEDEAAKEVAELATTTTTAASTEQDLWSDLDAGLSGLSEVDASKAEVDAAVQSYFQGQQEDKEGYEIVLPSEELDDSEKVVAGALMSLEKLTANEVGGARAIADALDAMHAAILRGQEEALEASTQACPRCASLLAVNFRHISSLLDVYAPKAPLTTTLTLILTLILSPTLTHPDPNLNPNLKEMVFEQSAYNHRGELGPPLGSHRLRAVELVLLLVQVRRSTIPPFRNPEP